VIRSDTGIPYTRRLEPIALSGKGQPDSLVVWILTKSESMSIAQFDTSSHMGCEGVNSSEHASEYRRTRRR
jgi:hypothetical protein